MFRVNIKDATSEQKFVRFPESGKLSASERKRRAREIIAESGADSVEYFKRLYSNRRKTVSRSRSKHQRWLEQFSGARKRKPVEPGTIDEWDRILNNWINPEIGDCPVSNVNNGVLKKLVTLMVDKRLVREDHRKLPPSSQNGCCISCG